MDAPPAPADLPPAPAEPAIRAAARGGRAALRRLRPELPWLLAFVPLTLLCTWPTVAHLRDSLSGERDSWQNLWNIVWLHRALASFQNPFFTHDLWHPDGVTLIFQTFALPDAAWASLLVPVLPPWLLYNLVVLSTFVTSGITMYALARGLSASRPAAFFSGCAYTFSTYHFAHALAHLHLLAIEWVPLFVLALWRVLEGGRWRWAFAGGAFPWLAALSSWYHLFSSFLIALGVTLAWLVRTRGHGFLRFAARGAVLCAVFLALIAPLAVSLVRQKNAEPYEGAHPADVYSADLQSFVYPNPAQALAKLSDKHKKWRSNAGEMGQYLGVGLGLFALAALALRVRRAGSYLLAGLVAAVFSLGPKLWIGGVAKTGATMPYALAVKALPVLELAGMPMRLAFVSLFALAAVLPLALDALRARGVPWWLLAPLAVLAVAEHAPHPLKMSQVPTPAPMASWAQDARPFAVLDASRADPELQWHQILHGHPVFGVWTTRVPKRLLEKLERDPVAGPLTAGAAEVARIEAHVAVLDVPFAKLVPAGSEVAYASTWEGVLRVPEAGRVSFRVESDDGAWLAVDGKRVVDVGGRHGPISRKGSVDLAAGEHTLRIRHEQQGGGAVLTGWVTLPGAAGERLLGGFDVPAGFRGTLETRRRATKLTRAEALAHLQRLHVRYVVQPDGDGAYLPETQLGLRPVYRGAGVRIYELPTW